MQAKNARKSGSGQLQEAVPSDTIGTGTYDLTETGSVRRLQTLKIDKTTAQRGGNGHKVPSLTQKLFTIDFCWGRK